MNIVFFILGAVLIYFGLKTNVGSSRKVSGMTGKDLINTGLKGYAKVMLIIGGITLILIGAIFSCTIAHL